MKSESQEGRSTGKMQKKLKKLKKFTLFNDLPLELRRQIWTLALPGPRVVDVRLRQKSTPSSTGKTFPVSRFVSSREHPVVLHVCRESRSEALLHYVLAFALGTRKKSPAQIYIDFAIDTVWFDHMAYFPNSTNSLQSSTVLHAAEFSKIRYLAIRDHLNYYTGKPPRLMPSYFPALEVISLVTGVKMKPYPTSLEVYTYDRNHYRARHAQAVRGEIEQLWKSEKKCPTIQTVLAKRIV
jgi:hypothetical protein